MGKLIAWTKCNNMFGSCFFYVKGKGRGAIL